MLIFFPHQWPNSRVLDTSVCMSKWFLPVSVGIAIVRYSYLFIWEFIQLVPRMDAVRKRDGSSDFNMRTIFAFVVAGCCWQCYHGRLTTTKWKTLKIKSDKMIMHASDFSSQKLFPSRSTKPLCQMYAHKKTTVENIISNRRRRHDVIVSWIVMNAKANNIIMSPKGRKNSNAFVRLRLSVQDILFWLN